MTLRKQLWLWLLMTVVLMTALAIWLGVRNVQTVVAEQITRDIQASVQTSPELFIQYINNTQNKQISDALQATLNKLQAITIEGKALETMKEEGGWLAPSFPTWFTRIANFENLNVDTVITSDTGMAVEMQLVVNPQYGYKILWPHAKKLAWGFVALGIGIYLISLLILQFLLAPLHRIIDHAKILQHKDFHIPKDLPRNADLRIISETLNHLTGKVQMMFDEHRELNRLMRSRAYQDSVTGLANRRFFDSRFEQILSATEGGMGGALFMIRISDIQDYRKNWGYERTDILLKHMAAIISQYQKEQDIPVMCHFGDADFAVVIMHVDTAEIEAISKKMLHEFNGMHEKIEGISEPVLTHIGVSQFTRDSYHHDVMKHADEAIRKAQENSSSHWVLSIQEKTSLISIDWPTLLQEKLSEEEVFIQYQPVFFYENQGTILFHNEALMRLRGPNGERFPAGMLLPLIDKMQLSEEYDKVIIKQVIERVKDTTDGMQRYAINITEQSLRSSDFSVWLTKQIAELGDMAHRLTIEFSEHMVKDNINQVRMFVEMMTQLGVQVGLDHFGCGFTSYGYLDDLKVAYVKIDGSYIRNIHENLDNQVIVRSFVEICHGLDILVIATTVEIEEEREILMSLRVDGMQGYFIGQPA